MPPVRKNKVKKVEDDGVEVAQAVVSGQLEKKLKKQAAWRQQKKDKERGVVFIKHLPHGFFEKQLKDYFAQFGSVTNVRLSRSKRTGGSKGFAFVEFEIPEVAQVAAETMNNYLMFKKVTKASYIPPDMQRYNYFKTSVQKVKNKIGKEKFVSSTTKVVQRKVKQYNDWSESAYQKRTNAKLNKLKKLNEKYAHLGIDFTKFAVEPKILAPATAQEVAASAAEKPAKTKVKEEKKSLLETVTDAQTQQQQKKTKKTQMKKGKKALELQDLLGNTIAEDSGDEDYIPTAASNEDDEMNGDSSDEELYAFAESDDDDGDDQDDDNDDDDDDDDDDDEEDEELEEQHSKVVIQKPVAKKSKSSNAERYEQLIKRKAHSGGIQKFSKKTLNKPAIVPKAKRSMQLAAAKEVAQPLQTLKNKKKQTPKPKSQSQSQLKAKAKATAKKQKL